MTGADTSSGQADGFINEVRKEGKGEGEVSVTTNDRADG